MDSFARETAGAARTRSSLRPLIFGGRTKCKARANHAARWLARIQPSLRGSEADEAIHSSFVRRDGLLRGACHRAGVRPTRWLAMTEDWPRGMTATLIRVARRQVARDLRAFLDVAADRHRGRGRAGAVGLLKTVIAAVEAGDHA